MKHVFLKTTVVALTVLSACNDFDRPGSAVSSDVEVVGEEFQVAEFCGRMKGVVTGYDGDDYYPSSVVLAGSSDLDDPATELKENELKATTTKFIELERTIEYFTDVDFYKEIEADPDLWVNLWDKNVYVCLTDVKGHVYAGKQSILEAGSIKILEDRKFRVQGEVKAVYDYVMQSTSIDNFKKQIKDLQSKLDQAENKQAELEASIEIGE